LTFFYFLVFIKALSRKDNIMSAKSVILLVLFLLFTIPLFSQEEKVEEATNVENLLSDKRMTIDFKNTDIRNILRAISRKFNVNIISDKDVTGVITINLIDIPVLEGLEDNVIKVHKKKDLGKIEIEVKNDTLTLEVENAEIEQVLREIAKKSEVNIIADQTVKGKVSGYLTNVELKQGIKEFLKAHNFLVSERKGILYITKSEGKIGGRRGYEISVNEQGKISMDITGGDLNAVLDEIAEQADVGIIRYGKISGTVDAKFHNKTIDEALGLLLQGSDFVYTKDDDIYLIGSKKAAKTGPLVSSKLIRLKHIKAEDITNILPSYLQQNEVKIVKEQNGVLIFGTEETIYRFTNFVEDVDIVSPQVMIKALILEVSKGMTRELELTGGYFTPDSAKMIFPEFRYSYTGDDINQAIDEIASHLELGTLPHLPSNFMLAIRALESAGKARVKAEPRIATLNGNEANIDVGWTGYYRTTTGTPENPMIQLHSVSAGIFLKIVPWVSASGEITTVINIEVSSLKGISVTGLPEISKRNATTTVRVNDGETIVIGGLVQTTSAETKYKIPILGSIPIIGDLLFTSQKKQVDETELIIYITPKIISGGEGIIVE
jgi:type IV pilus assembly protein PilQ